MHAQYKDFLKNYHLTKNCQDIFFFTFINNYLKCYTKNDL